MLVEEEEDGGGKRRGAVGGGEGGWGVICVLSTQHIVCHLCLKVSECLFMLCMLVHLICISVCMYIVIVVSITYSLIIKSA